MISSAVSIIKRKLPQVGDLIVALSILLLLSANLAAPSKVQQYLTPNHSITSPSQASTGLQTKPNYLETGRQITGILDRFMSLGYDKRVRPNYGGPPVEVNVTMRILSISSVSEVMMDFTADFYFRQTWHDPRLSFKKLGDIQTLYVGAEVSKKIWLPDTFFGNEKMAYFHEATTPNVFLRIDHSGEVYRSIRLTVTSSCPMNLQYFPMDRQRCTIEAESYGYNVKDIIYRWARKDTAVERDKEISLPQFDIVQTVQKYRLEELSSGTYSRLIAEIHFARRMGYYLIQIYIPSSLIVVISWVSFWLHRNASPARVQLGVTTVLTMTTLMSSTNAALPKISYVKSIDIFLGTCFVMVFAALLEYATVGYLGKRIAMRKAHAQHAQSQAQACLLAQLQAQGAQGEPLAQLASPICPSASAAASLSVANPAVELADELHNQAAGAQSSPLAGQLRNQTLASEQRGQMQQHHYLATESRRANQMRHHQGQLAPLCSHTNERSAARVRLSHVQPDARLSGQISATCGKLSHPLGLDKCGGLSAHHACSHQHHSLQHSGQQQHSSHAKRQHTCNQHKAPCRQPPVDELAVPASPPLAPPRKFNSKPTPTLMQPNGCTSCLETGSQTLPRGLGLAHEHQHQHQQHHLPAYQAPSHTGDAPLLTLQSAHLLSARGAPAGVVTASPSKGASAAAAQAAATFVNLHRKNKGLPPSTNPNFAQFNSILQPPYNRHLETIFGIRPSDIDKYSRVVFPVCFVCFQLMYWIVYLHISAFLEPDQLQQQQQPQQLVSANPLQAAPVVT